MTAGKTILVTGANGFLGGWLCKALVQNYAVKALVRKTDHSERLGIAGQVQSIKGDLLTLDKAAVGAADYCIHLAAISDIAQCNRDPARAVQVNVNGTYALLQLCREAGVKGIVTASTVKVYGNARSPVTEDTIPNPASLYGLTKLYAEILTREFCDRSGIPCIIPRFANIYGPRDPNQQRLIPATISSIRAGRRPVLYNDGSTERMFLYVTDAVDFLRRSLDLLGQGESGTFNVGSSPLYPVKAVIQEIARQMGWTGGIDTKKDVATERSDPAVGVERARSLGWRPAYPLERGLGETIRQEGP